MDAGVYVLAARLLDRLVYELASTRAGEPSWAAVHPGTQIQPHFEDCSSMAAVRVKMIGAVSSFPVPARQLSSHDPHEYAVTIEMVVDRCAYNNEQNAVPDVAELDSMARDAMDDAAAMRKAALCAWPDEQVVLGTWVPRSGGGVHGGAMDVTVRADVHCDCETVPPAIDEMVEPLEGDPRHM